MFGSTLATVDGYESPSKKTAFGDGLTLIISVFITVQNDGSEIVGRLYVKID